MTENQLKPEKKGPHIYLYIYLFIRIILVNVILLTIGNQYVGRGFLRILDALMFLMISLCVKINNEGNDQDEFQFPIYIFLGSGIYLFLECVANISRDTISSLIYLYSIVLVIRIIKEKKIPILSQFSWKVFYITVLTIILTLGFLFVFYTPWFKPVFEQYPWLNGYFRIFPQFFWMSRFMAYLAHAAMLEEPIFRFFLIKKLQSHNIRPWSIIIIQGIIFSLAHWGKGNPRLMISAFILAIIFGASSVYSRNIRPAIVSHTLYNLLIESIPPSL